MKKKEIPHQEVSLGYISKKSYVQMISLCWWSAPAVSMTVYITIGDNSL